MNKTDKKITICMAIFFVIMMLVCITHTNINTKVNNNDTNTYLMVGHYDDGIVETNDGNMWGIDADDIPNHSWVVVEFDNNNTSNYIYDDIIINIERG